jgi:hypothetical protein
VNDNVTPSTSALSSYAQGAGGILNDFTGTITSSQVDVLYKTFILVGILVALGTVKATQKFAAWAAWAILVVLLIQNPSS